MAAQPEEVLSLDDLAPSAFTGSSWATPPSFGRLHFPFAAWVAAAPAPQGEWLQVDLARPSAASGCLVRSVATQGHPMEPWWVSSYRLDYRDTGGHWRMYRDGCVFDGNADQHGVVEHPLSPPITATAVRFIAQGHRGKVALRVGLQFTAEKDSGVQARALANLSADLLPLVNSDDLGADVSITVRIGQATRVLLAHRAVLCARSEYFAQEIAAAEMKPHPQPQVGLTLLDVVDPEALGVHDVAACETARSVVLAVLRFLYAAQAPPREFLYPVRRLAERLRLTELHELCTDRLCALARLPENAVSIFAAAESEGCEVRYAALQTIVTYWQDLTVDWEEFSREQILQIVDAVERARNAAAASAPTTSAPALQTADAPTVPQYGDRHWSAASDAPSAVLQYGGDRHRSPARYSSTAGAAGLLRRS